jgi:hypothetical protein
MEIKTFIMRLSGDGIMVGKLDESGSITIISVEISPSNSCKLQPEFDNFNLPSYYYIILN